MVGLAIGSSLKSGYHPSNSEMLLAHLFNTSFMGVSGFVSVDKNGDRVGGYYGFLNFQTAKNNSLVLIGTYDGAEVQLIADPIFSDGTSNIPRDPVIPILFLKYNSGAVALVVFTILALVIFIISAIFVIATRNNRLIRRSSPTFLLVILTGLSLSVLSVLFWMGYPTPALCHLRVWFGFIGCALAYGFVPISTWYQ